MSDFVEVTCAACTMHFWITAEFRERLNDGRTFYCPLGHGNCYQKRKADVVKLEVLEGQGPLPPKVGRFFRRKS